jgi:hypothetical protein
MVLARVLKGPEAPPGPTRDGSTETGLAIPPWSARPAARWLLHRRMGNGQQMRWSPRGARRMPKLRTAVADGTLPEDHVAAER